MSNPINILTKNYIHPLNWYHLSCSYFGKFTWTNIQTQNNNDMSGDV